MNPDVIGGYGPLEREFGQMVSDALHANHISVEEIAYSVIGTAGVDSHWQHQVISEIVRRQGLRDFTLSNDAYLGIYAGTPAGAGICAISGTGCTIAGIDRSGKMLQIGGLGSVSDDMGGGGLLGMRVVSSVYASQFRKGRPTLLTGLLFQKLGIESKHELAEILTRVAAETTSIPAYNSLLFEAAGQGDAVAMDILRESAENYARGIHCMAEELSFDVREPLYIVLAGSVFVKAEHPLLVDALMDQLHSALTGYRIEYIICTGRLWRAQWYRRSQC